MALFKTRISSFGREGRASGLRAFIQADSIVIRLVVFLVMGGIFYLVVQATHKTPRGTTEQTTEQSAPEKQPQTK